MRRPTGYPAAAGDASWPRFRSRAASTAASPRISEGRPLPRFPQLSAPVPCRAAANHRIKCHLFRDRRGRGLHRRRHDRFHRLRGLLARATVSAAGGSFQREPRSPLRLRIRHGLARHSHAQLRRGYRGAAPCRARALQLGFGHRHRLRQAARRLAPVRHASRRRLDVRRGAALAAPRGPRLRR